MTAIHSPLLTKSHAPVHAAQTRTESRLPALDATRILATLGVVWFHTATNPSLRSSGVLGRFSVSFYTMAAVVFLVISCQRRQRPFLQYALDRVRRLYLPFLAWSAITLLVQAVLHTFNQDFPIPTLNWTFLIDGQTLHLWYIPFLLVASLLIYPIAQWMSGSRNRQLFIALASALFALSLDLQLFNWLPATKIPLLDYFLDQSALRWSAIYWGIAVAIVWINGLNHSRLRTPLAILGAFALFICTSYMWNFGIEPNLKVYGGLGLLLMALAPWKSRLISALAPYGKLSSGIYFAHMAAIYIASEFLHAIEGPDLGPAGDVFIFLLAITAAFLSILLLSKTPGLQWLAGLDTTPKKDPTPKFTYLPNPTA